MGEIHFQVESEDRILVSRYEGFQCRHENALEMLCDLVQNWPDLWVGRNGGIIFHDSPPGPEWKAKFDLAFCSTKWMGVESSLLPFPCPYSLRWPEAGIPDAEAMMEKLLADQSPYVDDRIFWIGSNTHPSRQRLCELGIQNPKLLDAEIMQWDPHATGGPRSRTRQVSLPEHRNYKYLIDCPGNGYSARIKWLLATGRPLFVVDRPVVEHWHEDLQPWVHYVPVKADLSDLLDQHAKLDGDPELYESIGRNARRFAAEQLTVEALLHRTAEAVWRRTEPLDSVRKNQSARISDSGYAIPVVAAHSGNMQPLYENFVSSLDPLMHGIRLVSEQVDLSAFREFGFQTESWYRMMIYQVELAIRVMEQEVEDGDYFIVCDIDIHIFKPEEIRRLVLEAAFAKCEFSAALDNSNYYNTGFVILRKCSRVTELYRRTLEGLQTRSLGFADQDEINRLIPELGIRHRPISPRLGVLGKQPVYEETVFYHATFAGDLEKKLARIATARSQMENRIFGTWQDF